MNPFKSSVLRGTAMALAITALALLVSVVVDSYLEANALLFIELLFLAAVWLSAWFSGRLGGFTATIASSFAIPYLFVRPESGGNPAGVWAPVLAFVVMAAMLTWVTAEWQDSRKLFSATLSNIGDGVLAVDRKGRVTFLNSVAETLTGWTRAEARAKHSREVLRLVREDNREPIENPLIRAIRGRVQVASDTRSLLLSRSDAEAPVEYSTYPLRGEGGAVRGAVLVFRDVSKRRQFEEQAIHDEKMDAVVRLAGGVAGDFSNVLTLITGYADLLRAEVPPDSPLVRYVDEIVFAGERASALTRQLLVFSQGSTAQPRVLDLNAVVSGMSPMLRRVLGQNIDLILLTSPELGQVKADAAQIELVMVNLANNARDAMPQGGKLVIETANVDIEESTGGKNLGVKPGAYVMLAVSDTGIGMDVATRSRLFEPFFTSKPPGQGSGLGLATVYGAVRKSDGQVTVYSQPGCGTIFEIYLPRVKDAMLEPQAKRSARGSETILLVDDEEGVCKLLSAILKSNGYDVLDANNGSAALAVYEKNAHKINLLLTDVVMPQMSGFELARVLGEKSPTLKILFMSGYRDTAFGSVEGEPPRAFLHKPFTPDILLAKVREVLDE
ncbi:MAG TPA: ATP-binding protein [Bryobacteraceae bacterium]|nr:ATP-binding protein [Bryobacteraceae bacterium]